MTAGTRPRRQWFWSGARIQDRHVRSHWHQDLCRLPAAQLKTGCPGDPIHILSTRLIWTWWKSFPPSRSAAVLNPSHSSAQLRLPPEIERSAVGLQKQNSAAGTLHPHSCQMIRVSSMDRAALMVAALLHPGLIQALLLPGFPRRAPRKFWGKLRSTLTLRSHYVLQQTSFNFGNTVLSPHS